MVFTKITETQEWQRIQADIEKRQIESGLKGQTEVCSKEIKEPFKYYELKDDKLSYGYKEVSKAEYAWLVNILNEWGVWNPGKLIKEKGATFVKSAVDLTLKNIHKIKKPGAYFRKVLENR